MLLLELSYVASVSSTGTVIVPWVPEVFLFREGGRGWGSDNMSSPKNACVGRAGEARKAEREKDPLAPRLR